jgi:hypothetical protein
MTAPAPKTDFLAITHKPPTVTPKTAIIVPKGARQVFGDTARGQATAKIFAQFGSGQQNKPLQLGTGVYTQGAKGQPGKEYLFTNAPSAEKDAPKVTYYPGTTTIGKNGKRTCTGTVSYGNNVLGKICEAKIPGRRFGWNLTTEDGKTNLAQAPDGTIPAPKNPAKLTVAGAPTKGRQLIPRRSLNNLPAGSKVAMGGQGKPDAQVYGTIGKEKIHLDTQIVDPKGREILLTGTTTKYAEDGITPIEQSVYTYTPGKNGKPATIVRNVYDKNGALNEAATTEYTVGSESSTAGGRWTLGDIKLINNP